MYITYFPYTSRDSLWWHNTIQKRHWALLAWLGSFVSELGLSGAREFEKHEVYLTVRRTLEVCIREG
ncbi:hypothetical protein PpBr36_07582 [Pyricularia pennisetigena]|uniref:hypothetical protein n=1 Tax=Pyricularia pennisetigena TaxID=1578925 RepID=UPI0011523B5F|nr:hypothetical protein PpBr36_07582 [Pyricularia pennisetigena]TLS25170.1 hypothetical protein PpBr36_07582 [Pyricularia pennisetigena]